MKLPQVPTNYYYYYYCFFFFGDEMDKVVDCCCSKIGQGKRSKLVMSNSGEDRITTVSLTIIHGNPFCMEIYKFHDHHYLPFPTLELIEDKR